MATSSAPDRDLSLHKYHTGFPELRRTRSVTTLAAAHYEERVERYVTRLSGIRRGVDSLLLDIDTSHHMDLAAASEISGELSHLMDRYNRVSTEFVSYLNGQRTRNADREASEHLSIAEDLRSEVSAALKKLRPKSDVTPEVGSVRRSLVTKSSGSHLTSVLLKSTAKVEEAKVKLHYAKEEAHLIRREAELKAQKSQLKVKQELDIAESSLNAVKQLFNFSYSKDEGSEQSHLSNISKRTADFVRDQRDRIPHFNSYNDIPVTKAPHAPTPPMDALTGDRQDVQLNPLAREFVPDSTQTKLDNMAVAKFLAKKDLLSSRLTVFDDQPAHYAYWKASFKNILGEIDASPLEHLDLLVKSLGPNSKQQAINIRCANTQDLNRAVRLIWQRLDDRFGSPESLEAALRRRIENFPKLSNANREQLYEIADLVAEIESTKAEPRLSTLFSYYDSSAGVNPIVKKLPAGIQEKWINTANKYKQRYSVAFPPFSFFSSFLRDIARVRNDPSFMFDDPRPPGYHFGKGLNRQMNSKDKVRLDVNSNKTDADLKNDEPPPVDNKKNGLESQDNSKHVCPIHGTRHTLNKCRAFRAKPLSERRDFIKLKGYCFKCCGPVKHIRNKCKEIVKCDMCQSSDHPSALHPDSDFVPEKKHEGEEKTEINSACTEVCNSSSNTSKSCAKIVLAKVYPQDQRHLARQIYCMIDDQSNKSLAVSDFFNAFGDNSKDVEYILSSCAGKFVTAGRRAIGYVVESLDGTRALNLPEIIECNDIPKNRNEIPSPVVASNYPHLRDIVSHMPEIDQQSNIELLIGRDLIEAHHVLDHRMGTNGLPYAQHLPLGWVIIGEVCLGKVHRTEVVNVNKINVLNSGRPTLFEPCDSDINVKCDSVFQKSKGDEKPGLSIEDQVFLNIMDVGFVKGDADQWTAPLPFRENRPVLPNNKLLALSRAKSFDASLQLNPVKRDHAVGFMENLFKNGHAELAPEISPSNERWYLPLFGVYHPMKPEKIRMVFDSSAKYQDVSLNDVLLKGPDLCNNLLGILLRFRREAVAVTMDVEQMFYNFKVPENQRDFLRFLWHMDNDPEQPLVDYRMTVHVFGNSPSPAVATYGMRKSVEDADPVVKDLVNNNFYVDDGLLSCSDEDQAIRVVHKTKQALHDGGSLRLHKFTSNSRKVLDTFDLNDLAKDLKDLDLGVESLPIQRSLGLLWDTERDVFTFKVSEEVKPYTKRGVLSTINSLYDPLGLAAPVVLRGKLFMRDMMSSIKRQDWDDLLPESLRHEWESWVQSLNHLEKFRVPRKYSQVSFSNATGREVHIFSDASKEAIGAVAYLKLYSGDSVNVSFLLAKSKVAPVSGHTIPRLELCGAVLSAELADIIQEQLGIDSDSFHYYTDSQVVLGYITNETRRFYVYVGNRVGRIRRTSRPNQWNYVASDKNPADIATRPIDAADLQQSNWIKGPEFLMSELQEFVPYPMIDPDIDKEVRPELQSCKTETAEIGNSALVAKFSKFSDWESLVRSIAYLKHIARRRHSPDDPGSLGSRSDPNFVEETRRYIIKTVQQDVYKAEISAIQEGRHPPSDSNLLPLAPILSPDGLLRVGGRLARLKNSNILEDLCRHPIILPKQHHVSVLLVRFYHQKVCHQGRHLTEGSLRSAGFWVIGSKRLISSEIAKCIVCRKLRGQLGWQHMADLPVDRLKPAPPFSYVGVDAFGPWPVVYRRTRGGAANQKRWALLFSCLVTRAIHIEVIEELSSSSFINALRRFVAIRGPVVQFRSDRGTNFVGATEDLSIDAEFIEKPTVVQFLSNSNAKWIFNPPHASHMGGAWERLIGVSRRILDSMLLQNKRRDLTNEILVTFMAEVCAIVNNRPLLPVSSDPESPCILTPSSLLTMKTDADIGPFPIFGQKDMLKAHWKHVQVLAEEFWCRWRTEYVQTLQTRKKWLKDCRDVKPGDVVLMKDQSCSRNEWPMGIVERTFPSEDGKVRKVELTVVKDDKRASYVRPVSQLVTILEVD